MIPSPFLAGTVVGSAVTAQTGSRETDLPGNDLDSGGSSCARGEERPAPRDIGLAEDNSVIEPDDGATISDTTATITGKAEPAATVTVSVKGPGEARPVIYGCQLGPVRLQLPPKNERI
ncbi:MAG: hypothetical protein V6Z86_01945 [Hyphomicrobiales bacterium]